MVLLWAKMLNLPRVTHLLSCLGAQGSQPPGPELARGALRPADKLCIGICSWAAAPSLTCLLRRGNTQGKGKEVSQTETEECPLPLGEQWQARPPSSVTAPVSRSTNPAVMSNGG